MSLKVTIASSDVRNQSGISAKSGKPYSLNFQSAYVHTVDKLGNVNPFPEKIELILDTNEAKLPQVYTVGEYVMVDSSIYVDRQGNLAVKPVLQLQTKSFTSAKLA